ncbi:MAG TPA: HAD family hydrolase [Chthoniobacterales bacterium]|nr:HAD family hydrolase [Chthoniobacterales bacterium]
MIRPYQALATDYDGTLAHHGTVSAETLGAIERWRASGKKLVLVTGRELEELKQVFPEIGRCDLVVAENGALLYWPATGEIKLLAEAAPVKFAQELRARGVPVAVGRVIVATVEPHEVTVLQTIKEMGLELEMIFNKGAVMILPTGVNKATGLRAGLARLGLSTRHVIGVGDAENDHAFLRICGSGIAVANALPSLKERADFVTARPHGEGVTELVDQLLANNFQPVAVFEQTTAKPEQRKS